MKLLLLRRAIQGGGGRSRMQRGTVLAAGGILAAMAFTVAGLLNLIPEFLSSLGTIAALTAVAAGVVTLAAMTRRLATHASTTYKASRRLNGARFRAEAENRLKSGFLAGMSHELRTPLNAIMGFSEIIAFELLGPGGNPKYREYARDIFDSAAHLLSLVNDILDLSKIEADKVTLEEERICLEGAVNSVLRLIREKADNGRLRLTVHGLDALPDIWADERRVKQVLLNLLGNAVKFTPEGGTINVYGEATKLGSVKIHVMDTGIGMNDEQLSLALLPFEQVRSEMNRGHDSTGLGLPLAGAFMKLHSGSLGLESAPGAGTCAIMTFPKSRVLAPAESILHDGNVSSLPPILLSPAGRCEASAQG